MNWVSDQPWLCPNCEQVDIWDIWLGYAHCRHCTYRQHLDRMGFGVAVAKTT